MAKRRLVGSYLGPYLLDFFHHLRFHGFFFRFSQGRQTSSFDCNPGVDDLGLDDVELLLGVLLKQLWVGRLQLGDLFLHELTSGVIAGTLFLVRGSDHDLFVDELADQACSLIRRDAFRKVGYKSCFFGCVIYILVSHGLRPVTHLRHFSVHDHLFRLRFHGCFLRFSQGRQAVSFDCNPGIDDLGLDDVDLLLGVLLKQHRVGRFQLGNFCLHEIQNCVAWLYTLVLACGRIHNLRVNKLVNKSSCLIRRDAFREVGGEPGFSGCVIHVLVLQGLHPLCDLRV